MTTLIPLVDNLIIYEGDDTSLEFITQLEDLGGCHIVLQVRDKIDSRYAVITVLGKVTGSTHYTVAIPSTLSIGRGSLNPYNYGIKITNADGLVHSDRRGTFTIEQRATDIDIPVVVQGIHLDGTFTNVVTTGDNIEVVHQGNDTATIDASLVFDTNAVKSVTLGSNLAGVYSDTDQSLVINASIPSSGAPIVHSVDNVQPDEGGNVQLNAATKDELAAGHVTQEFVNVTSVDHPSIEESYLQVQDIQPATMAEPSRMFGLVRIVDQIEGISILENVIPPMIASGFTIEVKDTGGSLMHVSKGHFSLNEVPAPMDEVAVGDPVYIDEFGVMTLEQTKHQCGWRTDYGVLLDVELYNMTLVEAAPVELDDYVRKYTRVDAESLRIAYQGMYGSDRVYFPANISQVINGDTWLKYTGDLLISAIDKDTGLNLTHNATVTENEWNFFLPLKYNNTPIPTVKDVLRFGDPQDPDNSVPLKWLQTGEGLTWNFNATDSIFTISAVADEGGNEGNTFDSFHVQDHVITKSFPFDKQITIDPVENIRYNLIDGVQIHHSGLVDIIIDTSVNTEGTFNIENMCNYYWDYPEVTVQVYKNNVSSSNRLGNFILPYGVGANVRYDTANTSEQNMSKGYISWLLHLNAWSIVDDKALSNVDTSSFDPSPKVQVVRKEFTNQDLISIPVVLPDGVSIIVSNVISKYEGRIKKEDFEYVHENDELKVHLNKVCSGVIIAEIFK